MKIVINIDINWKLVVWAVDRLTITTPQSRIGRATVIRFIKNEILTRGMADMAGCWPGHDQDITDAIHHASILFPEIEYQPIRRKSA